MRNVFKTFAAVGLAVAAALPGIAQAQGTGKAINDAVTDFYDGVDSRTPSENGTTTLGDAIQGGF